MGLWSVLNIHNEVGPSGVSAKGWPHLVRSLRELMEKQLSQGSYTDIRVLEAERQSCNVAFHFHHVVQDQMGQHHHRVLSHPCNPRAALAPTDLLFQLQRIASAMKLFSVVAPPPRGLPRSTRRPNLLLLLVFESYISGLDWAGERPLDLGLCKGQEKGV